MIGLADYGISRRSVPAVPTTQSVDGYVRPSDWLPLSEVQAGDQRLVALVAVYPHDSNHLSFVVSGDYTVDWGDGVVENFSAGQQANKNYVYSSLSANDTTRGYRQAILTITPQSGQTLTSLNFNVSHPAATQNAYSIKLLDVVVAGANINNLLLSGTLARAGILESFRFPGDNSITSFSNFLNSCSSLQSLPELDVSNGTSFIGFLNSCSSLQSLPALDVSNGTNFTNFLVNCSSLQSIPELDVSNGTNFTNFLQSCTSLQSIPELDVSNGTNFNNFLNSCTSLQSLPELDVSNGASFNSFLRGCTSLQSLPELNVSNGTSFTNFLQSCFSLGSVVPAGLSENCDLSNKQFSRNAILAIFNGLATVSAKTINISSNYGAADLTQTDRDIAINKGWIIIG
jgi:hypothetical protein